MAVFPRARRQNPGFRAKNRPKSLFFGRFSRRLGSRSVPQHFCAPGARWTCGNGLVGTSPKLCLSRISIFCLRAIFLTFQCGRDGRFWPGFRVRRRQKRPFFVSKKAFFRLGAVFGKIVVFSKSPVGCCDLTQFISTKHCAGIQTGIGDGRFWRFRWPSTDATFSGVHFAPPQNPPLGWV